MPLPKKLRTSEPEKENDNAPTNNNNALNKKAKTVKAAATRTVMPPHPDDEINVDNMIVNDLRKELRKRQLSVTGRKAELQARLREHLTEAKRTREAEWAAKNSEVEEDDNEVEVVETTTKPTQIKQVKICGKKNVNAMDVVVEDANEKTTTTSDVSMRSVSDEAATKQTAIKKVDPPIESEPVTMVPNKHSSAMMKHPPKSALKPSKYTSSGCGSQNTPQLDDAKQMPLTVPKQLLPTKISDSSADSAAVATNNNASSKSTKLQSVQKTKISSTLAYNSPGGTTLKAKIGGSGGVANSAKLLEKKKAHSAASEARKARLAEMRQKAKPSATPGVGSATKPPPSHSKYAGSSTLKKMASNSALGENKTNSILAKMREKAAAEKNSVGSAAAVPPMKSTQPHKPLASSSSTVSSASNGVKKISQVKSAYPPMKPSPSSTALKSIHDPANKPTGSKKPSPKKVQIKPLSPMQTYEMSDREEESDSESDSDDEYERQRPKKSVPEWAQKANLHRALERQFADGPNRLDPDKIFGEVLTCNLEEIFDKKKSRYQRRTSSGNWSKDHVSLSEKMAYKRTMGLK